MEEKIPRSQSDKDRQMASRFGGEKAPEIKIDEDLDDEDSSEKKDSGKGVFSKREQLTATEKLDEKEKPKRMSFFEGLLKKEVEADVDSVEKDGESQDELELTNAFQDVVVERIDAVEKELELPQPDEQAFAAEADAAFLGRVGDRLGEGLPPEKAIDDALEDEFEPPETDASENDLEQFQNFNAENDTDEDPNAAVVAQRASTNGRQNPPTPPNSPNVPPNTPNNPQNPNLPPNNPNVNMAPNTPYNPNLLYPVSGNQLSASPNVQSTPNTIDDDEIKKMNEYYYRKGRSGGLLLGGIAGYMLGRRGGRKRAEALLEPQIEKKDKELNSLSLRLQEKEEEVRKLALDRASVAHGVEKQVDVKLPVEKPPKVEMNRIAETVTEELKIVEAQEQRFEKELSKADFNEVIVDKVKTAEVRSPIVEEKKDARTMTMSELLDVAEHVMLEKTSLRELYERQRIDAVNLRRVVIEYMNGGTRYEKVLRGSLEAVEMQRELRNEIKRDDPFSSSDGTSAQSSSQSIDVSENANNSSSAAQPEIARKNDGSYIEKSGIVIPESTAIALGIITGIAIMILLFFYFSSN